MEERRMEDKTRMIHKVYLNARKSAVLSGVRDVLSFDAKEVYLETEQGVLLIQGDELQKIAASMRGRRRVLIVNAAPFVSFPFNTSRTVPGIYMVFP